MCTKVRVKLSLPQQHHFLCHCFDVSRWWKWVPYIFTKLQTREHLKWKFVGHSMRITSEISSLLYPLSSNFHWWGCLMLLVKWTSSWWAEWEKCTICAKIPNYPRFNSRLYLSQFIHVELQLGYWLQKSDQYTDNRHAVQIWHCAIT